MFGRNVPDIHRLIYTEESYYFRMNKNENNVIGNESSATGKPEDTLHAATPALDYFLQSLVGLANDGLEIGITLTVGGFLVSGILVSGKRYFNDNLAGPGFADHMGESAETIRDYFRSFGSIYDDATNTPEGAPRPLPTFLHLYNARFFHNSGKPIPANRPIWWRGRISEIQGFTIGSLSAE